MNPVVQRTARALWVSAGLPERFLQHLHLSESADPSVNSSFKLGTAAQVNDES